MIGDGPRWCVPEAVYGQRSSQAECLDQGDAKVMGLGFRVKIQFLRDLEMIRADLVPRSWSSIVLPKGKLVSNAKTEI